MLLGIPKWWPGWKAEEPQLLLQPKTGQFGWYRGYLMIITDTNSFRNRFVMENGRYEVIVAMSDAVHSVYGYWYIPGLEGATPRVVHDRLMAPLPPESRYRHDQAKTRDLVLFTDLVRMLDDDLRSSKLNRFERKMARKRKARGLRGLDG